MRAVLLAVLAFTTISAVPLAPRQLVRNESASSNSILEAYYIAGRWVDVDEFNSIAQSRSTAYFANNSMRDAALGSSPVGPSGNKCVGNYEGIIIPVEDCKLRSFCYIYCNAWGPVQTLNDWDTKLSAVVYNSGGGVCTHKHAPTPVARPLAHSRHCARAGLGRHREGVVRE